MDLLDRLEGVRQTGDNKWLARCPSHDDGSPSLSIRDVGDKLLLHCFAGCEAIEVVHALGLELSDLFADSKLALAQDFRRKPSHRRIPPRDILQAIDHEAHVIAVIGADVLAQKEIDNETWDRLALAVSRIGDARAGV